MAKKLLQDTSHGLPPQGEDPGTDALKLLQLEPLDRKSILKANRNKNSLKAMGFEVNDPNDVSRLVMMGLLDDEPVVQPKAKASAKAKALPKSKARPKAKCSVKSTAEPNNKKIVKDKQNNKIVKDKKKNKDWNID